MQYRIHNRKILSPPQIGDNSGDVDIQSPSKNEEKSLDALTYDHGWRRSTRRTAGIAPNRLGYESITLVTD